MAVPWNTRPTAKNKNYPHPPQQNQEMLPTTTNAHSYSYYIIFRFATCVKNLGVARNFGQFLFLFFIFLFFIT